MSFQNLEIKCKGFLRTALSAEASTTTIDIDWVDEDNPNTVITPQSDSLMFEIDPLNTTGKGSEICLGTSLATDTPSANRTRYSTVTRGLLKYGASITGSAARAKSWDAGTPVAIATGSMAKQVNKLVAQHTTNTSSTTYSGNNTHSGAEVFTGSIKVPVYADATARDAAIVSPANGMIVYLTDQAANYQYIGGAWTTFATGSVVAAADHTAGKVDIASATEIGAGTATDATSGAINVIPVSQTAKTSSGAGDENKLPVLNASGDLADGFISESSVSQHTGKMTMTAGEALTAGNAVMSVGGKAYKTNALSLTPIFAEKLSAASNDYTYYGAVAIAPSKIVVFNTLATGAAGDVRAVDITTNIPTSGTTTSYSTLANAGFQMAACKVATDKVAYAFSQITDADAQLRVISYSGTTPTAGTAVDFETGTQTTTSSYGITSPDDNVVVVAWNEGDSSERVSVIAATISGTVPTFGSAVTLGTPTASHTPKICAISSTQFVVVYNSTATSTAKVGTLSGTTITMSTSEYNTGITNTHRDLIKLSSTKVLLINGAASNNAIIGTVSGTGTSASITWGTAFSLPETTRAIRYADNQIIFSAPGADINYIQQGMAIYFANIGTDTATYYKITNFSEVPVYVTTGLRGALIQLTHFQGVNSFCVTSDNKLGYGLRTTAAATDNAYVAATAIGRFVGFADANASADASVVINTQENTDQSGLVTGYPYYLAADGAIDESGVVFAGVAESATTIVIGGMNNN